MADRRVAAVDVGSTRLKYALGTTDGQFHTERRDRPTGGGAGDGPGASREEGDGSRGNDADAVIDSVIDAVAELQAEHEIDAISVVTTGLIDEAAGTVEYFDTADSEGLTDVPIARRMAAAFDRPTYLLNDCNAAAVGEWAYGAGTDVESVVYVTMATGIGAGIVADGRLLAGEDGQAGEVGLLSLAPFGGRESDDIVGAWEAYCSGRGLPGFARTVLDEDDRESVLRDQDDLQAPDVFAAAAEGDPIAEEIIDRVSRYNAAGLGSVINVVNPGVVTLGGGVALNNPDVVLDGIERYLEDYVFVSRPPIEITSLGADLELLGAIAAVTLADTEPYRS